MIYSNIPSTKCLYAGRKLFIIGDYVRVLYANGHGGIIGEIKDIRTETVLIDDRVLWFSEIYKMKEVSREETFDNTPWFDEEEKEFWRTYKITKNGIQGR